MIGSEDYLLRQIVQVAEAVSAIIAGTPADIPEEELADSLEGAYDQLLGPNRPLVDMLDIESAARLVGAPFQVRAYVDLMLAHAAFDRHSGSGLRGSELAVRAEAFLQTLAPADEDRDRHGKIAALLTTEPYR